MCKKILVIISSKNPTQILVDNINNLYSIQCNDGNQYKIICVDSDSTNFDYYEIINQRFPSLIDISYVKNQNYEYGAYKYAYNKYPDYDIYICIQDTLVIKNRINISNVNDSCCYCHYHNSGYFSDMKVKSLGITLLQNTGLDYKQIIDTPFTLAQHSSFIVSNYVMNDIFNTLINPPTNKFGSCSYERLFGLYFILKNIKTIDLQEDFTKTHGKRI
jgi:hypothetical protein